VVRCAENEPALLAYSTTKFLELSTVINLSKLTKFYYPCTREVPNICWFALKSMLHLGNHQVQSKGDRVQAISSKQLTISI